MRLRQYLPLALLPFGLLPSPVVAQNRSDAFDGSSFGFQIQQIQNDFGVGGHFTTCYLGDRVALRLGASGHWLEHIPSGETTPAWDPYLQVRIGVSSRNFVIEEALSIYGEGGLLVLRPSDRFSEAGIRLGGYGLLGVEFHLHETLGQFIEIGGAGTGARAELSEGSPIHSNGLVVGAGMRWYW